MSREIEDNERAKTHEILELCKIMEFTGYKGSDIIGVKEYVEKRLREVLGE